MKDLKPCPFCGGEADIYDNGNETYSVGAFGEVSRVRPSYYKVFCKECGACGSVAKVDKDNIWDGKCQTEAREQAVNHWNTRAGAIIVNNFGKECKQIKNEGHITINVGKVKG